MSHLRNLLILVGLGSALTACNDVPSEPTDANSPTVTNESAEPSLSALAANTWMTRQPLMPWRMQMAAGTISGTTYVVGGRARDGAALSRVDAYRVATNTWSQVASLPSARANPNGATMINGKLYVTGGSNQAGGSTRTLFVYDPEMNRWTRKADMPRPSCGGDQGMIGGMLYVYTGCYASDNAGAVLFRYNPNTDTWMMRAAPPNDHKDGAGAVVNGRFHLVSGFRLGCGATRCDDLHSELDVYNPATNTWMTRRPIPQKVSGASAVMLNGKLHIAAGNSFGEPSDLHQVYDPMSNTWMMQARLPSQHSHGAAAMAGGKVFYVAGIERLQPPGPSKVYAYTP
jgi:N-acetylneuraminic acid mutarotase